MSLDCVRGVFRLVVPGESTPRQLGAGLAFLVCMICSGQEADAFSLYPDDRQPSARDMLVTATRWSAELAPYGSGLHDGLQVAVEAGFAADLSAVSDDPDVIEEIVRSSFAAWQTPELRFDIDLSRIPVEGTGGSDPGYEIDLFAVPETHPVFGGEIFFGIAQIEWFGGTILRRLTKCDVEEGRVTVRTDIYINIDTVSALVGFMAPNLRRQALQRLLIHEIGHTLGFGHPNDTGRSANFDNDLDPYNVLRVDPENPLSGIVFSPVRSNEAIMSNQREVGRYIFFTELQNDDRAGRDVLYPSLTLCGGDCDGNGEVDVTELLTAVNVALGESAIDLCYRADRDEDNEIRVDEIMRAVSAALDGCPPSELFSDPDPQRRTELTGSDLEQGTSEVRCGTPD